MSADVNSEVVTGGSKGVKKPFHLGPRLRLAIVLLGVVVLLSGLAGGGLWVAKKLQKPSKIPKTAATTFNGKPLTDRQKSEQAIYYGEYDKGQGILKDQVADASNPDQKIALYTQLATNALNKQKYDEANGYAQTALSVKKTAGGYSLLAQIAAKQGDKTKALAYANQGKALLDPKAPQYEMELGDYDAFIASLNK